MDQQGLDPDTLARAGGFFDRALAADPDNVDALVGSASVEALGGINSFASNPAASFASAEAKLVRVLSTVPNYAMAHLWLGLVGIWTKRAAEGIERCERALSVDRNLANAHAAIAYGKILIGRAQDTEAHVAEARRLSPRDSKAFVWMAHAGQAKNHLGQHEPALGLCRRAIELNQNYPRAHFLSAVALAQLGRLDEARALTRAGLAINPSFSLARARAHFTALSDNSTYLAQLEAILDGLHRAGLPE